MNNADYKRSSSSIGRYLKDLVNPCNGPNDDTTGDVYQLLQVVIIEYCGL